MPTPWGASYPGTGPDLAFLEFDFAGGPVTWRESRAFSFVSGVFWLRPGGIGRKTDEACWKTPSVITGLTTVDRRRQQKGKTTVRVVYDDACLYVAYECPDLQESSIGKDGNVGSIWTEDGADFMFDTPGCARLCDRHDGVCAQRFEDRTKAELEGLACNLQVRFGHP